MDILYRDGDVAVCVKPPGVLSTDEPGGMPELVRRELGVPDVRTVHRLDRVTGGLMVLALNPAAAASLGKQVMAGGLGKEYLAVVHGAPPEKSGELRDLLRRDKRERKTYVAETPDRDTREAALRYEVLDTRDGLSLVRIALLTGRTHQIRAQFSSRGMPLAGDRKYGPSPLACPLALWSARVAFTHPRTGEAMAFTLSPPDIFPWNSFDKEAFS